MSVKETNPKGLRDYLAALEAKVGDRAVAVGFPRGKCGAYGDGTEIITVAAVNNYGSSDGTIPARPLVDAATPKLKTIFRLMAKSYAKDVAEGRMSANTFLKKVGQQGERALIDSLENGPWEANAKSTVNHKTGGRKPGKGAGAPASKPLIDTGHLRASITSDPNRRVGDADA